MSSDVLATSIGTVTVGDDDGGDDDGGPAGPGPIPCAYVELDSSGQYRSLGQ